MQIRAPPDLKALYGGKKSPLFDDRKGPRTEQGIDCLAGQFQLRQQQNTQTGKGDLLEGERAVGRATRNNPAPKIRAGRSRWAPIPGAERLRCERWVTTAATQNTDAGTWFLYLLPEDRNIAVTRLINTP